VDCEVHDFEVFGCHPGWTGYTWNRELFPDPAAMIDWLHKKDLRVALNLHPADGVWPHEEVYEKFANCMGISQERREKKPIPFDITDPLFTENYFRLLHHTQEEENGVDFWWIGWLQLFITDNPLNTQICIYRLATRNEDLYGRSGSFISVESFSLFGSWKRRAS
jgi:alpha-glucosidase (family GH31 glycosyl hydrolase)